MKIVYILDSLSPKSGTERAITEKANYLSEQFGYDIIIIVCTQLPEQPNAYNLSNSVKQIYLRIPYHIQYWYKYPKRLWIKISLYKQLKDSLSRVIKELSPDILIGTNFYIADIVCGINCKAKKIIECHITRKYVISGKRSNKKCFSKLFIELYKKYYFKVIEIRANAIVTLSEEEKKLWNNANRVEVIPNFTTMNVCQTSLCDTQNIIAVGRLTWEKGYYRLIDIWSIVVKKHPSWKLNIYGEGELEKDLKNVIIQKRIPNIFFHGVTDNLNQKYYNSSICVVTSIFEAFSLVLLEAMKHGVPCIAFDCPDGPRNIIKDGQCGFLIEDGNINLFAENLCKLIEDQQLRKQLSIAAIERSKHFDIDIIMEQWKTLFISLTDNTSH